MRLKWTESQLKYFSKPIPVTQQNYDWIVWFVLSLVGLCGVGYWIWTVVR